MPFVSRLGLEQIAVSPDWQNFDATVDGLVRLLVRAGQVSAEAHEPVTAAVRAREAEASTAILDIGVGIPHARVDQVAAPSVALAVHADGVYRSVPTAPIRIVALVLSPTTAIEEHLRTLADVATLLHSGALRALLLRAEDQGTALAALVRFARGLP